MLENAKNIYISHLWCLCLHAIPVIALTGYANDYAALQLVAKPQGNLTINHILSKLYEVNS